MQLLTVDAYRQKGICDVPAYVKNIKEQAIL